MNLLFILLIVFMIPYLFVIFPRISCRKDIRPFLHTTFAHRGYHCIEQDVPENSMKAFRAALARGYGIEIDLRLTKDRQLVVFHDDTLQRICGRPDRIEDMTYEELKSCRLSGTDETIPLFTEFLTLIRGRVPLLIELKIPDSADGICEETFRRLRDYRGPYMVQSFNTFGLRWFKQHAPQVLRGQLSADLTKENAKEPWILRFLVTYLLSDVLGRPDFISYKMDDLPNVSVWILQHILRTPVAVWTLQTPDAFKQGRSHYDIQIFERSHENY